MQPCSYDPATLRRSRDPTGLLDGFADGVGIGLHAFLAIRWRTGTLDGLSPSQEAQGALESAMGAFFVHSVECWTETFNGRAAQAGFRDMCVTEVVEPDQQCIEG